MKQVSSSRRLLLLGGMAGLATAGIAGTYTLERHPARRAAWVEDVVRRHLPGVRLDEESLAAFVQKVLESDLFEPKKNRLAAFANRTVPALAGRVRPLRRQLAQLERQVLSEFLLGSNFFRVADPARETIVHSGRFPACDNPFARFT